MCFAVQQRNVVASDDGQMTKVAGIPAVLMALRAACVPGSYDDAIERPVSNNQAVQADRGNGAPAVQATS